MELLVIMIAKHLRLLRQRILQRADFQKNVIDSK
jgi:hypothetical protein